MSAYQAKDPVIFSFGYRSISITSCDQKVYNIMGITSEISLYEDIFANSMSGSVVIVDDVGLLDKIQLQGNEKLTVEFVKDPNSTEVFIKDFILFSVREKIKLNQGSEGYVLHFTSIETVLNENTRCYQAVTGSSEESVQNVFKLIGTEKKLETEATSGTFKTVLPGWSPFQAMNWFAGKSVSSESGGSFFLFFEDFDGFKFKCVDTLATKPSVYEYFYEPSKLWLGRDRANIRDFEFVEITNTLKGHDELYTRMWTHDLVRKKLVKKDYDVVTDGKPALNAKSFFDQKNGFGIDLAERRKKFGGKLLSRWETRNVHTQTQDYHYPGLQGKLASMRKFSAVKIRFLAFGNRDIKPGSVITLNFLKPGTFDTTDKDQAKDKIASGKYLVTAVRTILNPQEYHIVVEAVKDSKE